MRNCLQFNIGCLYYTGFWPSGELRSPKKNVFFFWRKIFPTFQVSRTIYGIFVQSYNIYLDWGRVSNMVEYTVILAIEIKVLLSMYILMARRAEIEWVVKRVRKMQDFKDGEEGKCRILEITNKIALYFSIFATVAVGFVVICVAVVLIPYGLKHRVIPFRKWFPVDVSWTPLFEMTLFTIMTTQTTDMFVLIIFDLFFVAIIIQMIGQYHLIGFKLQHITELVSWEISVKHILGRLKIRQTKAFRALGNRDEIQKQFPVEISERRLMHFPNVASKSENKTTEGRLFKRRIEHLGKASRVDREKFLASITFGERDFETARFLRECVIHHMNLNKLFYAMGSLMEPPLIFQGVSNGLIGVGALYVTTLTIAVDVKVEVMCAIMFGCTVEFFAHCILGTLLFDFSAHVSYSTYCSDWVGLSRKVKRSMQIVMARTTRGVVFKALTIFPMTLDIFLTVGKFSYSLYAVLDQISTGKKGLG